MSDDKQIREKLAKIKALFDGATSTGKRQAAQRLPQIIGALYGGTVARMCRMIETSVHRMDYAASFQR